MTFLYIIVGLVLVFDFINGFHDSANSIATVVSTKVLSPLAAVSMAAFFNFIAFTVFPLKVAATIGKGVVEPDVLNLSVIAAALIAAITWNLLTWWWGLPSSSSHTLVGGLVGAAQVSAETAGALTLFGATHFGIPVSTTHTITGAIIGVGSRKGLSAVKWGVTTNIFYAWILTIPVSAVFGALIFFLLKWIIP